MQDFLPVTKKEMQQRGWEQVDFVYLTGDAYVDHPSFGTAIISRLLGKLFQCICQNKGNPFFSVFLNHTYCSIWI